MGARQSPERASTDDPPEQGRGALVYHGSRIALLVALAVATYALFPTSPAVDSRVFEVGSVATENVIAPFGFVVRKTDAEIEREGEELARGAKPVFVVIPAAADSAEQQLSAFMARIGAVADSAHSGPPANSPNAAAALQRAASDFGVGLTLPEAEYLAFMGRRRAMAEGVRQVFARWLPSGVAASGGLDDVHGDILLRRGTEERSTPVDSVLTFGGVLARARRFHPDPNSAVGDALFIKLLSAFFHPTVALDRATTEARRQELRASVEPVRYSVKAGEKIVGEHEVVGRVEFDKLRALHGAMQGRARGEHALARVAGAITYNALVLAIFGIAIVLFRPQLYRSFRVLASVAVTFLIVLVCAAAAGGLPELHPELIPVALAAITFSILFDPHISMIAAMMLAVLVGGQGVYRGTNTLFITLVAGAAAAMSVRVIGRRDQAYYRILMIVAAYFLAAFALGLTLGWGWKEIAWVSLFGAINAVASVAIAMFLVVPIAERVTRITTDLTLLEYSDLNSPLLRRLSLEAPGTYAHTIALANLAESAANAIGANGLLARVGTYYDDIGKLKKPQYFVENQARGRNPHDKLKPGTSATIIRNHVREGLELADEYKLPPAIAAFIAEHHGTGPISYFLEKAKERSDGAVSGADFAYPGPVPQTPETAIVMLADGVEAAVRVLNEPTPANVREVIERIVKLRIEQGQLRDAPLTLQQLEIIKDQFARVLAAQHHNRIDYPASSGGITSEFVAV